MIAIRTAAADFKLMSTHTHTHISRQYFNLTDSHLQFSRANVVLLLAGKYLTFTEKFVFELLADEKKTNARNELTFADRLV